MGRSACLIVLAALLPAASLAASPSLGRGFSLSAPGAAWSVARQRPDAVTFIHHPVPALRAPDAAPYALTAGAQAVTDAALFRSLAGTESQAAARAWLGRRLQAPRRDIAAFEVRPAELHGAHCAAYDALQVDRYDPARITPDHVEDEEFAQHGMVCAHPSVAGLVVQVFYNERYVRGAAPGRRVTAEEMRVFFEQVEWTR
jgi:hypothetical protein